MYFSKFNKKIQKKILELSADDSFQWEIYNDKKYNEYKALETNRGEEFKALQAVLGLKSSDKFITPAVWSFLWVIESPFVTAKYEPSDVDVDLCLYLIENGVEDGDLTTICSKSLSYSVSKGLTYEKAKEIIVSAIRIAFRPLNLFPSSNSTGNDELLFDADWLTSLVARVHSVTGELQEKILNEMSLTSCCYYFAQYARINGDTTIYKRSPEEIMALLDLRVAELIVERLIKAELVKEAKREITLKIMVTPVNK